MYEYPVLVTDDGDPATGYRVVSADVPELNSVGGTREEVLANAVDGLITALSIYVDTQRPIPAPAAPKPGQPVVRLPVLVAAKVALWNAMCERGMRKADLARLLHASTVLVDRLVDPLYSSKIENVEEALEALGKRLVVEIAN